MPAAATTKKATTLTEALIAFQSDLPKAVLDKTNPAFKSKYLSLGALTEAVFPALVKHGFAYTTLTKVFEGTLTLEATLLHESGESLVAQFPITDTIPQKVGSAVTYYRRYGLASLTGIVADEDDDGNAASNPTQAEQRVQAAKNTTQPKAPAAGPNAKVKEVQDKIKETFIDTNKFTKEEVNATFERLKKDSGKTGYDLWVAVGQDLRARDEASSGE